MKYCLLAIVFLLISNVYADVKEAEKFANEFLSKVKTGKSVELEKMWTHPSETTKERIPVFLKSLEQFKELKLKSATGIFRSAFGQNFFRFLSFELETADEKLLVFRFERVISFKGNWRITTDIPDSFFVETKDRNRYLIGCESKEKSIQTAMSSFAEITTHAMGSQVISMVCFSCCPSDFKEKYLEIDFSEKHLKGGIVGLPWRKLSEKQALKRENLKLKSVKDISKTEIIATFVTSTHEISGPMILENNRWLFALGKAEVYQIKDGKKTIVDLSKL